MPPRLPALGLFRTFEAAGRHLSFKRAATELHVTPAAVSQQIRSLEDQLGLALFVRLTRAMALTTAGAQLLPTVSTALGSLSQAVGDLHAHRPGGGLTVIAPPGFASHWLLPRLADFQVQHPEVELLLDSSSGTVAQGGEAGLLATLSQPPAPGEGGCRLAVLYGSGPYPGWRVDDLLTPDLLPVCTPGLLAAGPPLRVPADLCRSVLIQDETFSGASRSRRSWGWPQWLRAAGVRQLPVKTGPRFANATLAIEAALAGQGVALAPQPMVAQHLASGALVAPFPQVLRAPYTYRLVGRLDRAGHPAVAAFRQWLLAQVQRSASGSRA
jgi:LysR family transcriptional regulator, glycine cleavage system transcriptional activator